MFQISGLLFLVAATPVQAPAADELLGQADRAMADSREVEAFDLYGQVLERNPADLKALVGASWLAGKLSTYTPPGDEKTEYTLRALSLAEQAYALAPEQPEVNLVMAWASGGKALISGVRERVQRGLEMKAYLDLAVAGQPEDPRGWYLLGRWCRRIATANVLERAGARMVGATLPDHISLKTPGTPSQGRSNWTSSPLSTGGNWSRCCWISVKRTPPSSTSKPPLSCSPGRRGIPDCKPG